LNDLRAREDISQGVAKVTCQILAGFHAFSGVSVRHGLEGSIASRSFIDEVFRVISSAHPAGIEPVKACCATARISYETFRTWCMSDPQLAERFYEARERGRVNALRILQQAAAEDWRAAAEWLRLAHRSEYSTRAEISVEGAPKQDQGIVIDSVMLTRLQGAYQQTLESIHRQEPEKQNESPNSLT
jgi:hypothetical protein